MTWRDCTLGEVVRFQRGHDLPDQNRKPGDVPVIGSAGQNGWHNEALAKGPGVSIGRSGASIGKVTYTPVDYWPHNACLYVTDFLGNNPRFIYYFLRTKDFSSLNSGAAQPSLNRNFVHALTVKVPGPSEQAEIAERLAAYDDLVENNRRRIALLEEAARMLYREWFIDFRFPGHEHVKIVDDIPEGWARLPLGNVAVTNAESYAAKGLPNEIAYIDIGSVTQGRIAQKAYVPSAEAPGRARRKASDGDVIWSNVRPNLRAYALVLDPEETDVFSTGFTVLSPRAVPFSWLYLFVTTDNFVAHLVNHATGAGYPAVRPDDFERAIAVVPPPRLLALFHEATEANFRLISKLNVQCEKLAQARDLLLPRLMNGEIAV
ncbi:restriction endonuclease subunit S [Roseococcus sp. SYP-B2431]|uniref:restriction endonuclease subunit S n=1 Tax=Roseococcus sp. SYP-B2431 TaxID=2496640 RepID=UPI00103E4666|nr:restriction endonuclease subunit S [Roseococcus sp. SYP-B2431]TCH97617.1 restriction endonuclease subunit S [Roseococcus sp. SYP-B2431]